MIDYNNIVTMNYDSGYLYIYNEHDMDMDIIKIYDIGFYKYQGIEEFEIPNNRTNVIFLK